MSELPLKLDMDVPKWEILPLKKASILLKDGTHGTHERVQAGIPLLSAKNISPFGKIVIDEDDSLISENEYKKIHSKYELRKRDLLLTVVGTLGRSALIHTNERFSIQRSICVIRCAEATVSPEFMYHFSGTDYFQNQLVLRSNATAQAGIYLGELAKIDVPCPPLPEQKKIAAILSSVDDVIEKTRAQIDKLKDLKTGMMQELLTKGIGPGGVPHTKFKDSPVGRIPVNWEVGTLGDITESSAFGPRFSSDYYSQTGNIGCIRTTDMDENWDIDYSTVPLADLNFSEFASHILREGDLLPESVTSSARFPAHTLQIQAHQR